MENYTSSVVREGLSFGEAPRWHDNRLWYSDFYRHGVYSLDGSGNEHLEHVVTQQPSGLGWLPNGDLLCVSMKDRAVLRFSHGTGSTFADISEHCGFWANDMTTSTDGFSYVGNFGFDLDVMLRDVGIEGMLAAGPPPAKLIVLNKEGHVVQLVDDMIFPNGIVITPDGRTLMVAETMAFRVSAFDIAADGTLSNRRVWAQLDGVAPDGMCLDSDGQLWIANALGKQCVRVKEGGVVTATVTTNRLAFACMLGGSDRRTLYIMTAKASSRFDIEDKTVAAIESVAVPVAGAGLP
jgi:sugar lactone lactonase YvrE